MRWAQGLGGVNHGWRGLEYLGSVDDISQNVTRITGASEAVASGIQQTVPVMLAHCDVQKVLSLNFEIQNQIKNCCIAGILCHAS